MMGESDLVRASGLVVDAPRRLTPATLVSVVLAILGLLFGLLADPTATVAPTFFIATLCAFNTLPALLFAALTLVAGLGTMPIATHFALSSPMLGALAAGVALGLLGRELSEQWLARRTATVISVRMAPAPMFIALAALGLALTFLLPDTRVRLAGGDGQPLFLQALLVDPGTATRMLVPIPAWIRHDSPLADLDTLALMLASITAFAAIAAAALRQTTDRILRDVARGTAFVAGLVALVALGELLFGHVALDAEALRQAFTFEGRAPVLDLAVPVSADLRLWSRPMVDGLRLVAALLLVAATLPRRAYAPVATLRWLPLALAAAAIALLGATPPMALAGGLVVGLGTLVVARMDGRSELIVHLAMTFTLVLWLWGAFATAPRAG